jgi:hypothetical protein
MITFICPSIRPKYWNYIQKSIHHNKIKYEILFIGPKKNLGYRQTDNCKFIKSYVKPSQCFQIGVVNSKYNLICLIADDIKFSKKNILQQIHKNKKLIKNKKLLSLKLKSYGVKTWQPVKEFNYMHLPVAPIIEKKLFFQLGGIDKGFLATFYDLDLYLRILSKGYNVKYLNIIIEERERNLIEPSLYNRNSSIDKKYFKKLWFSKGKFNLKRAQKVKKFKDKNLTNITQPPYGKWKNNGVLINSLKYNFFYFIFDKILKLEFNFIYNIYLKNKHLIIVKFLASKFKN